MKKMCFLIFSVLCFISTIRAQQDIDFNKFQRLKSSGKIPDDITKLYIEKYTEDKSTISKSDRRSEKRVKDEFLQESNYYINQLLISGKILFNDTVTKYIEKIADNILKDQPNLRKTLRFYTVKSPSVNAFSTDKGIIFVNLGLLAQVTSEAQLAFVLSHEIVHYVKKHNMDFYLTKKKIQKSSKYDSDDVDESFLKVHHRSREMESEADNLGLIDYYSKTSYSLSEIDAAMDVLQYAYLPFDDIKFDKAYFETPFFTYPDSYRLDNITPIKGRDDYDDTLSTHPNVLKRRLALKELIKGLDSTGKHDFIQPKETFLFIKKLARFECINQFIIDQDYDEALYNSYIMLQEYPKNFHLKKAMATSMYLLAKYKLDGEISNVVSDYKKIEGESQQLNYLLKKLERKDFCVLALRDVWKLSKQYPDNEYLINMKNDIFKEMFDRLNIKSSDFNTSVDTVVAVVDTTAIEKASNKYDRIKLKKKNTAVKEKQNYFNNMLVDLMQDSTFKRNFNENYNLNTGNNKSKIDIDGGDYVSIKRNKPRKNIKVESNEELLPTHINNILVLNPMYYKVDQRKQDVLRFMASDQKGKEYIERIKNITKKLNIKTSLLIPSEFSSNDVDLYNDYSLLKDFMSEAINMPYNSNYILNSSQFIDPIIEKYNTRYLNFSGVFSSRVKKSSRTIGNAVMYAFLIYPIPFSIYSIAVPEYYTVYFNALFDIKTGKVIYQKSTPFYNRDRSDYLNSQMYDSFNKIKNIKQYKSKK